MNRAVHLAFVVVFLAACASQPEATRYYLLEPTLAAPGAAVDSGVSELAVGPVTVSAYLDQPQIVTRSGDEVINRRENDRWASPLVDGVRELILRRLTDRLPSASVSLFPGAAEPARSARRVAIDILRLDGAAGGAARIVAQWRLFDPATRTWAAAREFSDTTPAAGATIRDLVAAESALLESFADAIAESL